MIKINFLKFFKKKKKFIKNNVQPNPNLYWMIVLSIGFVVMMLFLVFSFYLFVKVNKKEVPSSLSESQQLDKISKQRIDKVLETFVERSEISNRIQNLPAPFFDPSI